MTLEMLVRLLHSSLRDKLDSDIESLIGMIPFSVTSSYRSIKRNKEVGGQPTSWHLDNLARDITFDESGESWGPDTIVKILETRGYRVMPIKKAPRSYHVQFNFPIIKDFSRENIYDHLEAVIRCMINET